MWRENQDLSEFLRRAPLPGKYTLHLLKRLDGVNSLQGLFRGLYRV